MREIVIHSGAARLEGTLVLPSPGCGLVVFAHGSGSSRKSPRNAQVARVLRSRGLGTLLFDLLSEAEGRDRALVFDIELLGSRVLDALRFLHADADAGRCRIGLFGASTGAAAALAAAARDRTVAAVVSRGGRPDLAMRDLPAVVAPTLLIVGGSDRDVLALNEKAASALHCEHRLAVVPGATHLFEEPGTLEEVCTLAGDWFVRHLARPEAAGGEHVP